MSLGTIARFAGLTIRETLRRRILAVLLVLAVVAVGLVGLGVDRLVDFARRDGVSPLEISIGVSQVLILIAFMFSFVLAMSGAFLAAPAIAADVESGIALAVLARPVRRSDVLLGRWLGLAVIITGYTVVSGALAIGVVGLISGALPPQPVVAIAYLAFEALCVVTLALALGTRLPSIAAGAITVVAFGLGWFAGVLAGIAQVFGATELRAAAEAVRILMPTDGLWRGVLYGLEPPIALLMSLGREVREANPFYADTPPPLPFVLWSVVWVAGVLGLGILAFRRREL